MTDLDTTDLMQDGNIGLGVEFGQILVGLDTQLGFCKIMDGNAPHNANIGITVGYKF